MKYTVIIPNSVRKDLNRLPSSVLEKILRQLRGLEENPRPTGCKKLKNRNAWRVRVDNYRILYEINDDKVIIVIIRVRHRKEVYR